MDVFRTPDERFADLPGWDLPPQYVDVDGLHIHHIDVAPDGPPTGGSIVLFHGEPTWSYLYRRMIAPLVASGRRVIAYDHAGFGRSDKPTDRDWYSFDRHSAVADAVLDHLDVRDATVVVQDWAGPIGLRWATEHPDRVANLVIMNTGLFSGRVSRGFLAWRDFAAKNPDLPVGQIIRGATVTDVPAEVIAAYDAPFPTVESKAGAAQFPLLVPVDEADPGAEVLRGVADVLSRWEVPTLLAFSDSDPVFPHPKSGQVFTDLIPSAGEQVTIVGAAHFLQEDKGEEIAAHIVGFLDTGGV